jgi:hypothetical protein
MLTQCNEFISFTKEVAWLPKEHYDRLNATAAIHNATAVNANKTMTTSDAERTS